MTAKYYLLMVLLIIALINDSMTHKIKNIVLLPFFLGGLLINGYLRGLAGILDALLGSLIPILALGVFFAYRLLRAGDIKLFSTVGAIMGSSFIVVNLLSTVVSALFIALLIFAMRDNAGARFKYLITYLKRCLTTLTMLPYRNFIAGSEDAKFPYVYAIAVGTTITILFH